MRTRITVGFMALACAVVAVVAVVATASGPGAAATSPNEAKASAHEKKKIKRPKVKHGVLKIEGADHANDRIHTAADTLDRIDFSLAHQILRMNTAYVASLAP